MPRTTPVDELLEQLRSMSKTDIDTYASPGDIIDIVEELHRLGFDVGEDFHVRR